MAPPALRRAVLRVKLLRLSFLRAFSMGITLLCASTCSGSDVSPPIPQRRAGAQHSSGTLQ
jgi:hypothetical protein